MRRTTPMISKAVVLIGGSPVDRAGTKCEGVGDMRAF
jgi:hypothetical protein